MRKIFLLLFTFLLSASDNFYYQNDKKVILTPIQTSNTFQKMDANHTIEYFKTPKGQIVGMGQEIIVKLKDTKALDSLVKKYAVNIKTKLTNKLYVLEVNSTKQTLEITNKLYLDANVSYAHPNLIKRIDKR